MTLKIVKSSGQTAGQKAIDFASSKLNPKSKQVLSKITASIQPAMSTGTARAHGNRQNAIKIQDLVRRLNKD